MDDFLKEKLRYNAVIYDNIYMYFIKNAIRVVELCRQYNIAVLSLQAFSLSGRGIRPSQEHSIDFKKDKTNWDIAIAFLRNEENSEYLYEIWYDGY